MQLLLTVPVALFFTGMGLVALVDPTYTLGFFGAGELGPDMRNEVRAVYGGFGLLVGSMLFYSLKPSPLAAGIRAAIALSLIGMALGRVISLMIEPTTTSFPILFIGVELAMAGMLFGATARKS